MALSPLKKVLHCRASPKRPFKNLQKVVNEMLLKRIINDEMYLKFTYYVFKIFGAATFKVDVKSLEPTPLDSARLQTLSFASSRLGSAYNAILFCLLLIANYFNVRLTVTALFQSFGDRVVFEKIIDTTHIVFTLFTTLYVLAVYCCQQERTILIARKLKSIAEWTTIHGYQKPGDASLWRNFAHLVVADLATIVLIVVTTAVNDAEVFFYQSAAYPNILVINATMMQYSLALKLVERLFGQLNASFARLCGESNTLEKISFLGRGVDARLDRLLQLRELYSSLCDVSQEMSDFYAQLMLLCVSYIFSSLTLVSYYMASFVVTGRLTMPVVSGYLHCAFNLVHYVVLLIILANRVHAVVLESRRTGDIINKWIPSLQNQQILNTLIQFSNYLLHKNVQFTVFGLFTLDHSLLLSILGSITTYLVILLQFRESNTTSS